MKDFTRPRGRLRNLPLPARVVYSVFLVFTLAALGVTLWLGAEMVEPGLGAVREYYAGAREAPSPVAEHRPGGGPALDLPDDADGLPAPEPMSLRKLLEVTHFHLFSMPVYLLILSHLFMLGRARDATKLGWITLATLGMAAHLAAPWIARADAPAARAFYALSGSAMLASMLVMSVWPLIEMWTPAPAGPAGSPALGRESDSSLDA